jgi:PAS domain S-box-containing protein
VQVTRILVVEDSRTQAEQLRLILESEGYDVAVASSGEAALELVRRRPFDIVVSDIIMPGITGYDVCKHLKEDPSLHDIPVVLLSSLSDPMDIVRGLECGADNFVTKPYEPAQLVARLRTVLDNRRVRSGSKLRLGVEVMFLGKTFVITSDKEQILDLLMSTFEDIVRTNRGLMDSKAELAQAKVEIEHYAQDLERRVEERTAELQERQFQLARAQSLAHLGNWRWRIGAETVEWSEEMYRIFGVETEQFVPTVASILGAVHRDDRVRLRSVFSQSAADQQPLQAEFRIRRPDGEERHCWMEAQHQRDDHGVVAVFGIWQDITERTTMAAQLHQAQKMEAVGQLTGGVAHDFNNLISVMVGNLDLALEQLPEQSEVRPLVDMALSASLQGADLTRQLLAFSRKQQLRPKAIDINELVLRTSTLLRRTIGERIEIKTAFNAELWPAEADPSQVESALINLAINARDAMPSGGSLLIETANMPLDGSYVAENSDLTPGDYVMLAVTDTGTGIPPNVLSRVFEPFFTTKEVGKGTGLGLSMVYGFAKQSGGHLKIYSEVGHGTTVRLYLPRARVEVVREQAPQSAAKDATAPGETILVVEDNPSVRATVVQLLKTLRYSVLEAEDSRRAIEILSTPQQKIDLLFTDIVMPGGMSGSELAKRAREIRPELKVLYTSGFTETSIRSGNTLASTDPILSKPYRRQELAQKIREIVAR